MVGNHGLLAGTIRTTAAVRCPGLVDLYQLLMLANPRIRVCAHGCRVVTGCFIRAGGRQRNLVVLGLVVSNQEESNLIASGEAI